MNDYTELFTEEEWVEYWRMTTIIHKAASNKGLTVDEKALRLVMYLASDSAFSDSIESKRNGDSSE